MKINKSAGGKNMRKAKYNKMFHRSYRIDFDRKIVVCEKCGHKVDLKTFAHSLLNFCD